MAHPAGIEEYLLSDFGKIYGGSHRHKRGRPWAFGQFGDAILPAVCHILDKVPTLRDGQRGDPVKVTRVLSALVSKQDIHDISLTQNVY